MKRAADKRRAVDFVGECNCEVLVGNRAFTVGCRQKLVDSKAELAGPVASREQRRGRQKAPVQLLFGSEQVEECGALLGFGLVCHGKARRGHKPDARGHFKAASAADDEVADNLRIPGSPDQLERIAGEKVDRADRRIMAGQQASQRRLGP